MTADTYLQTILAREAVNTSATSPVRGVQATLQPILNEWGGLQLRTVHPSGSFAKGTAKSACWATYFTYPIFAVLVGYGENIGGLMVTAGTACVWALPFWSWLAARVHMRRLVVSGFLSTALLSIVAGALIGYRPWMAAILFVLAAGLATSIDAVGNTLFLRAVRSKDRLEMAPVFATFRDTAQFAPQILFTTLLVAFPLSAVFTAIGCMMLGMAAIAKKIPRSF
jgi:MFS family permease